MQIIFNHSGSNAIHMVEGIEVVDDLKVLGFTIDSKFGFSKHIDKAVKQSNSILFSIWRLGKIGYSKDELAILYRAHIWKFDLCDIRSEWTKMQTQQFRVFSSEPSELAVLKE